MPSNMYIVFSIAIIIATIGLLWSLYDLIAINFLSEYIFRRKAIELAKRFHVYVPYRKVDEFLLDIQSEMSKEHEGDDVIFFTYFNSLFQAYACDCIKDFILPDHFLVKKHSF